MNDEGAFLAAIVAQPDDDTARLVFADWLDERGDPDRASFIRLQIRYHRSDVDDPGRDGLDERARALFDRNRDEWLTGFPPEFAGAVSYANFERGFLTRFEEGVGLLPQLPESVWARHPIHKVGLRNFRGRLAEVLAAPQLAHVRVFWLMPPSGEAGMTDADAEALATCPHLSGVRSFVSTGAHGNALAGALARCPSLRGLSYLHLQDQHIDDDGIAELADSENFRGLRELWLQLYEIRPDAARALARAPAALERLTIEWGLVGDWGAEAFARSPHLAGLRELRLREQEIGPGGARALAQSPHLTRLRALDLSHNPVGPNGARALAAGRWPELTELRLDYCKLGDAGAEALAGAARLPALAELDLGSNAVGKAGALALARSERLRGLVALDLGGNPIGDEGALALCRSTALASLKRLWVAPPKGAFAAATAKALHARFGDA